MSPTRNATCSCGWFGSASESDRLQALIDEHVADMPAGTRHVTNVGDHPRYSTQRPTPPKAPPTD